MTLAVCGALLAGGPPARADGGFEAAVQSACAEGAALSGALLLEQAHEAYAAIVRAAPGTRCGATRAGDLLSAVERLQQTRDRWIERARTQRAAGRRRSAYRSYLAGLALDPSAAGPRHGLRVLLRHLQGDHCVRARELVATRLVAEARAEYARAQRVVPDPCPKVMQALLAARVKAYRLTQAARASLQAGDAAAARRGLIAALAADPTAGGAAATLAGTAPPLPTRAAPPAVTTRLEIGDCGPAATAPVTAQPDFRSVVGLALDDSDPLARALQGERRAGVRSFHALAAVVTRYGLPSPTDVPDAENLQDAGPVVSVAVSGGRAVVTVTTHGTLVARERASMWPWTVRPAKDGIAVSLASGRAPPGTKRDAEVVSCGWRLAAAQPRPATDRRTGGVRTALAWTLPAGARCPDPAVTVALPALDRMALTGGLGATALRLLGAMLLPLLLIAAALGAGPERGVPLLALLALVTIAIAWLVLAFGDVHGTLPQIALCALPLGAFAVLWDAVAGPHHRRLAPAIVLAVALAGAVWLPIRAALVPQPGVVETVAIVVASLAVGWVASFALISGAAEGLASGVGRPIKEWRPWTRRITRGLIALGSLAQPIQLLAGLPVTQYSRTLVFPGLHDVAARDQLGYLLGNAPLQPLNVFASGGALLTVIAAGIALSSLRLLAKPGRPQPLFGAKRQRNVAWLLFASVVIGTSAPLVGFPVPIALVISLLYLRVVHSRTMQIVDAAERSRLGAPSPGPSPLGVRKRRLELLDRAAAIRRERLVRRTLKSAYAAGDTDAVPDASTLAARLAESDTRVRQLTTGSPQAAGPPKVTVPLTPRRPPGAIALGLGPRGDWWQNGRRAVGLGWPLALLPVAFSAYVFLTGLASHAPWSLLFESANGLAISLENEFLFWLVSAFALGALLGYLPFRNSPAKAVLLAGIYIVPLALLELASEGSRLIGFGHLFQISLADWTFRGFELVLFLLAVAVRLDAESVTGSTARLRPLYGLDDIRSLVLYLSPVAVTVLLVGGQLLRGDATAALRTIIENAGNFLPGTGS